MARPRAVARGAAANVSVALVVVATACTSPAPGGSGSGAVGQEGKPAVEITADAAFLEQWAATYRFRLGKPAAITVAPGGEAVLFLRSPPRSFVRDLWLHDVRTGEERVLVTADGLLRGGEERLSAEELARRERLRLAARGIASYELSRDGARILVPLSGRLFVVERESGAVRELPLGDGYASDARLSPDGSKVGFVRDGDLHVIDVAGASARRLTTRRGPAVTNGLPEFVAQEEMKRFEGYWWSPDGAALAFEEADVEGVEVVHVLDASHPERAPQPWPYPRPGKQNAQVRLGIVPAAGGPVRFVEWDRDRHPYLARVAWDDGAPLTLLVQDRTQTEARLLAVEPATLAVRQLLVESDEAWVNLDATVPRWLPDGSGFLWSTESGGTPQLELRDATGARTRFLTLPAHGYRELLEVDLDRGTAWFLGGPDPTQTRIYRVSLDGGAPPVEVGGGAGEHVATMARDHEALVDAVEELEADPAYVVRGPAGAELSRLRSVSEAPLLVPKVELVELPPPLQLRAAVVRPRSFDPARRYPVVVNVYGGPHARMAVAARDRFLMAQWIADHGFVVVSIDGRGTPARGRAFERAIRGDFATLPLEDQVAGLQALGHRLPELDLSRVGIYGWSFGGYLAAMAAMRRPDVFRVAVAGAPVADWLDYDTHYTERYLGMPETNPQAYERSSLLPWAKDLTRPLLIVHGTADDNVYFWHSLKLSDALFRAGREHEFLPLSGLTHMVPDPNVTSRLYRRITSFLVRSLGAPTPAAATAPDRPQR